SSCDSAGAIAMTNGTGMPPFVYTWMDSLGAVIKTDTLAATSDSLPDLPPGNYSVLISDSFNCALTFSFSVAGPVTFNLSIFNVCSVGNTFAVATAEGLPPFTY